MPRRARPLWQQSRRAGGGTKRKPPPRTLPRPSSRSLSSTKSRVNERPPRFAGSCRRPLVRGRRRWNPSERLTRRSTRKLHKAVLAFVHKDAVCRRLMTVPGVGPVVAVIKSAVDDPSRITKSKAVGALFGLTPKKYQSGEALETSE